MVCIVHEADNGRCYLKDDDGNHNPEHNLFGYILNYSMCVFNVIRVGAESKIGSEGNIFCHHYQSKEPLQHECWLVLLSDIKEIKVTERVETGHRVQEDAEEVIH